MTKQEALRLIDDHKNKLIDPVKMLHWAWLRVIVYNISEVEWEGLLERAEFTLSR